MMRSLFSGVSGLKVHQTKMDVIGNNIANVNTIGFKGSTVNFSDVFYQTSSSASGPNEETGMAGRNAIQIGLGSNLSSITTNVATAGGSQRTDNPFDVMIQGDAFFIVNSGGTNYFTKNGAFQVDAAGTLCLANGANVMGWQVDENGDIVKGQVSKLQVMSGEHMYSEPQATTKATASGNIDSTDTQLRDGKGAPMQVQFYDNLGNLYTAKLAITDNSTTAGTPAVTTFSPKDGKYNIAVTDIMDANNQSIFASYDETTKKYSATNMTEFTFAGVTYKVKIAADSSSYTVAPDPAGITTVEFNPNSGKFVGIYSNAAAGADGAATPPTDLATDKGKYTSGLFNLTGTGTANTSHAFPADGVSVDFSNLTQYASSDSGTGTSKIQVTKGDAQGYDAGYPVGNMNGISIDGSGKIYGVYDNGTNKLLGQIAVASFANPSGLEAVGDSMFAQTKNSGEFDGIGEDPSSGNRKLLTGVQEMSNVDLSTEFTSMITTQRGFQANSRIITTSDTMLEELINLKR